MPWGFPHDTASGPLARQLGAGDRLADAVRRWDRERTTGAEAALLEALHRYEDETRNHALH